MARDWTREQQEVIRLHDGNLLVSAAAGSGKTAVLVERILTMIRDGANPLNIDRLLVVTFTKAAAEEMRERIGASLAKTIEEQPENEHLQKQQLLLHHASITTIDSFCMQIVKEFFHVCHLDPSFRVGDETEMELLRSDVIGELLEECYTAAEPEFIQLSGDYADGKTDVKLESFILRLYHFSESYPWPDEWLKEQAGRYQYETIEELESSALVKAILADIEAVIEAAGEEAEQALAICNLPNGPKAYEKTIISDTEQLQRLRGLGSYSEYGQAFWSLGFARLSGRPGPETDEGMKTRVKTLRDRYKQSINDLVKWYFYQSTDEMLKDMQRVIIPVRTLMQLVIRFREKYREAKEERNLLDFGDLEHLSLEILLERGEDGTYHPTAAAAALRERYAKLMIDEYQDSNLVQETLLQAISGVWDKDSDHPEGRPNIFMVGDVKQSIYRFRLARPELFMEKYETYDSEKGLYRKIDLHQNFRSRVEVLDAVNVVFEWCMRKEFGRIEYDSQAALYAGLQFPENEQIQDYSPELIFICPNEEEAELAEKMQELSEGMEETEEPGTITAEAAACAARIRQLTNPETGLLVIVDGKTRIAEYGDIAVLFRSTRGWTEEFLSVFTAEGIPARAAAQIGFFAAGEVRTVLNYLRILDNPRQDIPLAAVLLSPMVGLSNEEMAEFRRKDSSLYEDVCYFIEDKADESGELGEKLKLFMEKFDYLRRKSGYLPVSELIEEIYRTTGWYELMAAFPAGGQRTANLDFLLQQAVQYEASSYHGLFHFVRYVEKLLEHGIDFGEAGAAETENAVRIMSIHKSKGLEFPIVLLPSLGKRMNQADSNTEIVLHSDYGPAPDCIDGELRTRIPTLQKQFIRRCISRENIAEELRILYVAMTRAKEKLILVATVKNPEKVLQEAGGGEERMNYLNLSRINSFLIPVAGAVLRYLNRDINPERERDYEIQVPSCNTGNLVKWKFRIQTAFGSAVTRTVEALSEETIKENLLKLIQQIREGSAEPISQEEQLRVQELQECLHFHYPYEAMINQPIKLSVSELKRCSMMEAEKMEAEEGQPAEWVSAGQEDGTGDATGAGRYDGAERAIRGSELGTLYHLVLEQLPMKEIRTEEELSRFLQEMVNQERITTEERNALSIRKLMGFLHSNLAERMRRAAREDKLHREQPFVLGVPVQGGAEEDIMLVQGIIDLYFEEDDGLVLVDYKTDAANSSELLKRYRVQLEYYTKALEQITGMKVKETLIYSFSEEAVIPLP